MKKKRKSKGSVFRQLVVSYILFAVLSVVTLYLCMFGVLFFLGGGNLESLAPYDLVDDEGHVGDISSFAGIGGWIEKLDPDYQVTEIYGEKKDSVWSYTIEEISEYLYTDHVVETETSAREYWGFLKAVQTEGGTVWYLMKISRETLRLTYSFDVGNGNSTGKVTAALFLTFGALFLVNCVLMSTYLSRKIRRPLLEITEGMEQVKNGAGMVRLDFQAQKEFEEIRDSFNLMIEQLEQEKRINEEKKNRMLLELSHDLKTPVATIKGCANALEEGLDFCIRIPETPVYVNIDRKEFARVIENLLGNVVKYNQTGTKAEVEVRQSDETAKLFVRDDGETIAEDIRPALFEPFARGDKARQSKGGTGLGLAIAYKIVEKHGGKLAYRREHEENVFWAEVPAQC
ncbi:MAG: HAMP domain-containing histidine kinase [Ruminococcus sp.]|nr:HAMP domain-containing histidine kinase [Ruminococcus sp.]